MNYKEYVNTLESVCKSHPLIETVLVGDIYELIKRDTKYPAMIISDQSVLIKSNYYDYQMTFIYVDRQTPKGDNIDFIKSNSLRVLNDVINQIRVTDDIDCIDEDNITINFFKERFEDDCAGAFMECNIQCFNPKNYQDVINK